MGQFYVNEAVSFEKEAIFIAIPKTGTTSVRQQFQDISGQPVLIPNPHLNIMQLRDALYVYFLKIALARNSEFPTADNLMSDEDVRKIASETFHSFFKFSAVRNPWARAVSLYSRREGVQASGSISFKEFCQNHFYASDTCLHPTRHKNQYDWLCDEKGDMAMDYVYKLEDSVKAFEEIAEITNGCILLQNKKANVNPTSKSSSYRDMYDDETKKLIGKRFEKDIDCFKFSF